MDQSIFSYECKLYDLVADLFDVLNNTEFILTENQYKIIYHKLSPIIDPVLNEIQIALKSKKINQS